MDPLFFEEPESAPIRDILLEPDARTKQDLINLLGLPRYLSRTKVTVLDQDVDLAGMSRRLLALKLEFGERWCVVEVRCPSKGDIHYLWVPPEMERCSQAVAWTFGFDVEQYAPQVEA